MLIERAKRLALGIDELERLNRSAADADKFRTRANGIEGPVLQLKGLVALLEVFRERSVPVEFDASRTIALLKPLTAIKEAYEADAQSIVAADNDLRFSFWREIEQLPASLATGLGDAWTGYVRQVVPEEPFWLQTLDSVPSLRPQVAEIRGMYRRARELGRALPQGEATVAEVDSLGEQLRTAVSTLQGDGISEEVLAFINAASIGNAGLHHLTTTVREWISRHNLEDMVRVSLRGSAS